MSFKETNLPSLRKKPFYKSNKLTKGSIVRSDNESKVLGGSSNIGNPSNLIQNARKVELTISINVGLEAVVSISRDACIAEVVREVFSSHPNHLEYSEMENYCLCLDGKKLSPMQKVFEIGNLTKAKLSIEPISKLSETKNFASEDLVPKLTKKGYQTEPSYPEICRMSKTELQNVRNFSIKNEHARVVFIDNTDISGLDLDDIVNLAPKTVELYEGITAKPEIGKGLNKEA